MISHFAEKVVDYFVAYSEINEEDRDLYVYGFFLLFSKIYYFVITVLFGVLFNMISESLVFYLLFTTLRVYAGGIHAQSERTCMVSTCFLLLITVWSICIVSKYQLNFSYNFIIIFNAIVIVILSPQDSNAKRLTYVEKKIYKRKTIAIVILILAIAGITFFANLRGFYASCMGCILLESVLLVLGSIYDYNKKIKKNNL